MKNITDRYHISEYIKYKRKSSHTAAKRRRKRCLKKSNEMIPAGVEAEKNIKNAMKHLMKKWNS